MDYRNNRFKNPNINRPKDDLYDYRSPSNRSPSISNEFDNKNNIHDIYKNTYSKNNLIYKSSSFIRKPQHNKPNTYIKIDDNNITNSNSNLLMENALCE